MIQTHTSGPTEVLVSHDLHDAGHDEHHHHETFITKYVFSQDHKMICKQFLITGMIWAITRRTDVRPFQAAARLS